MKNPPVKKIHARGFTLIITISLLALLTVIGLGLLSLSAVSLRSSSEEQARSEARANARFALMLAIGELQKQLGPDQRVSANGAILDSTPVRHPHWTGTWDSWAAGTAVPSTSKPLPSTASEHNTIAVNTTPGVAPTYAANRNDMFQSWLVSLYPSEMTAIDSARNLNIGQSIQLVGSGSLGATAPTTDFVTARLLNMATDSTTTSPNGRYGWWVGDESQKARIMDDPYLATPAATNAERIFLTQSPGATGTKKIAGLENISQDSQLASLPSRANLDLVTNVVGRPAQQNFHTATPFSYSVLADTREGGLKRDLSTILEQNIDISNTSDAYMLYRFDAAGQQRVPIQDIAAFYQLYDQTRYASTAESWRKGVSYNSARLPNAVQIAQPELGDGASQPRYLREYQRMYKSVVPIKIQVVVTMRALPIPAAQLPGALGNTHYVKFYMLPSVTLWNPTNLPLTLNLSNNNSFCQQMRVMSAGFNLNWIKNNLELVPRRPLSLAFAAMGGDNNLGRPGWGNAGGKKATMFDMYFGSTAYPVSFEPGEVKVFSYNPALIGATNFQFAKAANDSFVNAQQGSPGWNPDALFPMANSIWGPTPTTNAINVGGIGLAIRATDQIAIRLSTDQEDGTDYSHDSEYPGSAFGFMMIQKNHQSRATNLWNFRNYPMLSRSYSQSTLQANYGVRTNTAFNDSLVRKGFPAVVTSVSRSASNLINLSNNGDHMPLFQFALMAGTETSESRGAFSFGGRKFPARPFLHSSSIAPPHIDKDDGNSLYNYGMSWWVQEVNSILEANIQVAPGGTNRGYYGGGNSPQYGTTHVVQQEIPVTPPISIAALSHAHLGGFSLANTSPNLTNPVVTAVGAGGLFPFTLRAIGNAYAHPLLAPDQAYTSWDRHFNGSTLPRTDRLVDHSYLSNKALWDEFYFSSITPQNAAVRVFESAQNRTAKEVAQSFFFNSGKIPNRRIVPFTDALDQTKLDTLFTQQSTYTNGLADKMAAHLMVEGPFNVNSTSVEAWKVMLSSLRGKFISHLSMSGGTYTQSPTNGVPISGIGLPLAAPQTGSNTNPAIPQQWIGWRELTDTEINELAESIVRQVKLRGPFLSMSDFVNRRLDPANRALSVKGALQAAIDDPAVSINAGFRTAARQMSNAEIATMTPAFPEALAGPVAYGSMTYVNQSDILRNFAEQLTPRGDTFIVRSYGESLDANGKVNGRAWCEAVIQRMPDYLVSVDESHVKQASLTSEVNRTFGRKLKVVSFRWLHPAEI